MTALRIVEAVDLATTDRFTSQAHHILADLVSVGAALGWVVPPDVDEVELLLKRVAEDARHGDADIRAVTDGDDRLLGLGYWRRYERPTHWPHADIERVAIRRDAQGKGLGRALTAALIASARAARIEVLTLDVRGDNIRAIQLYKDLRFVEYGRLREFVAVGDCRLDKIFYCLDLRADRSR